MSHGIVLGSDGRKMSKSLRNYPDVSEVFERDGSDAMRWFLMASPILRGGNLVVTEEGIRENVRQVLLPLWTTWYFFALYAGAANGGEGLTARRITADDVDRLPAMDRYLLARTRDLVTEVTAQLDAYDVPGGLRGGPGAPRRADQLVRADVPPAVLGRGHARLSTRSGRRSRCSPGSWPRSLRCCRRRSGAA